MRKFIAIGIILVVLSAVVFVGRETVTSSQTQTVQVQTVSPELLEQAGVRLTLPEQANLPISAEEASQIASDRLLGMPVLEPVLAIFERNVPGKYHGPVWVVQAVPNDTVHTRLSPFGKEIRVRRTALLVFVNATNGEFLSTLKFEERVD